MSSPNTRENASKKSSAKWALAVAVPVVALGAYLLRPAHLPTDNSSGQEKTSAQRTRYVNRSLFPSPAVPSDAAAPMITGRVYGIDGVPLPGAKVMASSFTVAGNVSTTVASVESDAEGRFELRVPDGTYQVFANKPGFGPTYVHAQVGDTVSLVMSKSGVIKGHVRDADDAPVKKFVIDVLTAGPDHMAAFVPLWSRQFESADGSFEITELPRWAVVVRASAVDRAPAYSKAVRLEPAGSADIDLTLSAGCTVEGTVRDASGNPLPFVLVDAESRTQSSGTVGMGELSMDAANRAESDENGHFTLEHAPMGRIAVRGYDSDHSPSTVIVDVADCKSAPPVDLVMTDGGRITGVARDGDGKPIPGARLTATTRATGFVNTVADEQGKFSFDDIPEGNARIELVHKGQHTIVPVKVEAGGVTERDLTLYTAGNGELHGRVTSGGKPLSSVQLIVAANRGRERGMDMYFVSTDKDGAYHLASVPEGHYAVTVASAGRTEGVEVAKGGAAVLDLDLAEEREIPQQ